MHSKKLVSIMRVHMNPPVVWEEGPPVALPAASSAMAAMTLSAFGQKGDICWTQHAVLISKMQRFITRTCGPGRSVSSCAAGWRPELWLRS